MIIPNTPYTIDMLKSMRNQKNIDGMAKFGINTKNTLGISVTKLREIAKDIGKNHQTALELWESKIHEARLLASFIDIPDKVTEKQMDSWVKDFDSWDVCDQCCLSLFDKTKFAYKKSLEWSNREEEYVKRASFALMACMAVHNKSMSDNDFIRFFPIIKKASTDERNYVKKAVNWALRQIGKRNMNLNRKAIKLAEEILIIDSKSAKWIASDALRELTNQKTMNMTKKRNL